LNSWRIIRVSFWIFGCISFCNELSGNVIDSFRCSFFICNFYIIRLYVHEIIIFIINYNLYFLNFHEWFNNKRVIASFKFWLSLICQSMKNWLSFALLKCLIATSLSNYHFINFRNALSSRKKCYTLLNLQIAYLSIKHFN
jgi:hypothetical protein